MQVTHYFVVSISYQKRAASSDQQIALKKRAFLLKQENYIQTKMENNPGQYQLQEGWFDSGGLEQNKKLQGWICHNGQKL